MFCSHCYCRDPGCNEDNQDADVEDSQEVESDCELQLPTTPWPLWSPTGNGQTTPPSAGGALATRATRILIAITLFCTAYEFLL